MTSPRPPSVRTTTLRTRWGTTTGTRTRTPACGKDSHTRDASATAQFELQFLAQSYSLFALGKWDELLE